MNNLEKLERRSQERHKAVNAFYRHLSATGGDIGKHLTKAERIVLRSLPKLDYPEEKRKRLLTLVEIKQLILKELYNGK